MQLVFLDISLTQCGSDVAWEEKQNIKNTMCAYYFPKGLEAGGTQLQQQSWSLNKFLFQVKQH